MYISCLFVFIYFGIEDVVVNECRYIFLTTVNGVFKLKVIPQGNTLYVMVIVTVSAKCSLIAKTNRADLTNIFCSFEQLYPLLLV